MGEESGRGVVESPGALARESGLIALGVSVAVGGLLLVPVLTEQWPWWYCGLTGGAAAAWALPREWEKRIYPVGIIAGGLALGLVPLTVHEWDPLVLLLSLVAGGVTLAFTTTWTVKDHRRLLREVVYMSSAQPVQEAPKAASYRPSSVCFARSTAGRKMESVAPKTEAQVVDNPEYVDAVNFGFFIDMVFPSPGRQGIPPRQQNWAMRVMPSGDKLGRDGLREYKRRLEKAGLAHYASAAPNAELVVEGTREDALECFRDIIILPGEAE